LVQMLLLLLLLLLLQKKPLIWEAQKGPVFC
jgi:hypothetical protein